MGDLSKQTHMVIHLPLEVKQRLELVAARLDIPVREYRMKVFEERLARDWEELIAQDMLLDLTASVDPVLSSIWDNEKDAAYDRP